MVQGLTRHVQRGDGPRMSLACPGFAGSAEDQAFRSRFVQWLVQQPPPPVGSREVNGTAISRTIVQYWHDPMGVPADVQDCIASWRSLRSLGFEHVLFNDASARAFIAEHYPAEHVEAYDLCYHPAMRCDYFRLCYIYRFGGLYVDADEVYQGTGCDGFYTDSRVKLQPLCYDAATEEMVLPRSFLTDAGTRGERAS